MLARIPALFIMIAAIACLSRTTAANRQPHVETMKPKANEPIVISDQGVNLSQKDIDRFWSKVDKNGPLPDQSKPYYAGLSNCWQWTGTIDGDYGTFRISRPRSTPRASRIAFMIQHGRLPVNFACHHCDNGKCVLWEHLYDGTQIENKRDAMLRERDHPPFGVDHWKSRLTEDLVRELRRRYAIGDVSYNDLATEYGIGMVTVHNAITRATWKRVI